MTRPPLIPIRLEMLVSQIMRIPVPAPVQGHCPVGPQAEPDDHHRGDDGEHDEHASRLPFVRGLQIEIYGDSPQAESILLSTQNLLDVAVELLFALYRLSAADSDIEAPAAQFIVFCQNVENQRGRSPVVYLLTSNKTPFTGRLDRESLAQLRGSRGAQQVVDRQFDLIIRSVFEGCTEARVADQQALQRIGDGVHAHEGAVRICIKGLIKIRLIPS